MTTPDLKPVPTAEERMSDLPEPPVKAVEDVRRFNRIVLIILLIAGVALATSLIVAAFALGGQQEAKQRSSANANAAAQANQKADVADKNASAAGEGLKEANRRLAQLGKPTVAVPTITAEPSTAPVPEGLSVEQDLAVRQILANELAKYQPRMTPVDIQQVARLAATFVPKPKDGKTPTPQELQPLAAAAQAAFCANGRCDGKSGPTGAPGTPGADGSTGPTGPPGPSGAPGKDAPAVTDEQLRPLIAERLAAYCAAEGDPCRGLRGERGVQGVQGRSLAGMDCMDDGRWRQYWVDPANGGAQETVYVDGPCRVLPLPPTEAARKTR